jgi:hypothetical protein
LPLRGCSVTPVKGISLVIFAYGDDGADEKKKRAIAVSIVAGTEDWWLELEGEWVVRCGGIPFHATDCESDREDFKNRSHPENKALYRDLTGILAASKVGGIGIAIDLTAERQVFPKAPPIAYFKAFMECIESVANVAENMNDVCEITYDIGEKDESHAASLYSWLRENDERLCRLLHPKVSFAPWRESARLQVADLLAFEAWKALDHTVGPKKRKRMSWEVLRATNRFETLAYSKEWFEDLKKNMGHLEKRAGFNETDYVKWLEERGQKHNVGNLISFFRKHAVNREFEKFDTAMRDILKVPHAEIKKKLDEEKAAKKRKKTKKSSASREAV